jgi:acyl-CoA synthetase (AMP-forming)/AMP-acid ligase II
MIVSGGENVFPGKVEEALASHPDISEVAVVGVSDDQYEQRLRSYIVLRPGASLSEQETSKTTSKPTSLVQDSARRLLCRRLAPQPCRQGSQTLPR